jgi:cob(I)alamin adenosyltransferase
MAWDAGETRKEIAQDPGNNLGERTRREGAMRIYTRTGDEGDTGLFGGERVGKEAARLEAYGSVDELNAALGWARVVVSDADLAELLHQIQGHMLEMGADLATPERDQVGSRQVPRIAAARVAALETEIDRLEQELPPLTRFILPGGSEAGARLHLARTICRRAERRVVAVAREETVNAEVVRYLNRLSDLLFVMARVASHRAGAPEETW